jgi:hypothetical protein
MHALAEPFLADVGEIFERVIPANELIDSCCRSAIHAGDVS